MPEAAPSPPPQDPQSAQERLRAAGGARSPWLVILILFGVVEPLVILGILFVVQPAVAVPVGAFMLLFPPLLFVALTRFLWKPTSDRYPPRPQSPDAAVRLMQSVSLGPVSKFNNCVHIAVDEQCLHLIPFLPMRAAGARVISIPWDDMTNVKRPILGMMSATLPDGRKFAAPKWCMQLVAPPEADPQDDPPMA